MFRKQTRMCRKAQSLNYLDLMDRSEFSSANRIKAAFLLPSVHVAMFWIEKKIEEEEKDCASLTWPVKQTKQGDRLSLPLCYQFKPTLNKSLFLIYITYLNWHKELCTCARLLNVTYLLSLSLQFLHAALQGFILLPPCSDVVLQDGNYVSGVTVGLLQTVNFLSPLAQRLVQVISLLGAGHEFRSQLGCLEKW